MRFRRVALLLLTYVALDFGNPMMPGAVQIVDGALEVVAGCQARSDQAPSPVILTPPRSVATLEAAPAPTRMAALATLVVAVPRPAILAGPPRAPRSTTPSSPDDD